MREHSLAGQASADARHCASVHVVARRRLPWPYVTRLPFVPSPGRRLWLQSLAAAGAILTVVALSPGCQTTTDDPVSRVRAGQPRPLVGHIWLSVDPGAALGTIRIFLADGTLVMDSCFETYRLARWETVGERRIAWQEDAARIEAEVDEAQAGQLRLRLHLRQEIREEHYRLAELPLVCPDLPDSGPGPPRRP
jgi:hypothetical protein